MDGSTACSAGRNRILVVEDEIALLRCFPRMLYPHDVELAIQGEAALEMLASRPAFDVVLCDLTLPDISGQDVYRRACARWPELRDRFLFMTGARSSEARGLVASSTLVRVLAKPLSPSTLRAIVNDLLRRSPPVAGL